LSALGKSKRIIYAAGLAPILEGLDNWRSRPELARSVAVQSAAIRSARQQIPPLKARYTTVIATYNRPALLAAAVQSALAQSGVENEVVVISDGGVPPALQAHARLHCITLEQNTANLGLVRNVGIALAHGEFVAFLDDDNTWRPDHLRLAGLALESADLSYSQIAIHSEHGETLGFVGRSFSRRSLARVNYVDSNAIVVRRSVNPTFSLRRRPKGSWRMHDWEFVYRTSRQCRVAYVPQVTVDYLQNPNSFFTPWQASR
jgi:glycosyltransferase involved in cell wall biosynthesis